jgi:hypothetical protein
MPTLDGRILDIMTASRDAASRQHSPEGLPLIDVDWDAFDPLRIQKVSHRLPGHVSFKAGG